MKKVTPNKACNQPLSRENIGLLTRDNSAACVVNSLCVIGHCITTGYSRAAYTRRLEQPGGCDFRLFRLTSLVERLNDFFVLETSFCQCFVAFSRVRIENDVHDQNFTGSVSPGLKR